MKRYGGENTTAQGGFIYEHKETGERAVSAKPNTCALPGTKADWRYIGREHGVSG